MDFVAWSRLHPSQVDIERRGPRGSHNPRDGLWDQPDYADRSQVRIDGPQWVIDAYVKAYLSAPRGGSLTIPAEYALPPENFLISQQPRDPWAAARPWFQRAPWVRQQSWNRRTGSGGWGRFESTRVWSPARAADWSNYQQSQRESTEGYQPFENHH